MGDPKLIQFWAAGIPKGQPRPRAFARKMGGKFVARVYDAGTAEGWKGQVALAAHALIQQSSADIGQVWVWDCAAPIELRLAFFMPRPKAHFRKAGLRADAPQYHTGKPDADNLAKAVMDALSVLNFWKDDAQVVRLIVTKHYEAEHGSGCVVTLAPISRES